MARKRYHQMDLDFYQPKRRAGILPWLLVVVLGLLAYWGYQTYQSAPKPPTPVPEAPGPARALPLPEAGGSAQPAAGAAVQPGTPESAESRQAPPPAAELPALEQSDDWFRQQAARLSGESHYQAWLRNEQLLRKLTVLVSNMAEGQLPPRARSALPKLETPFAAKPLGGDGTRYRLDPAGYRRYQPLVEAFAALDEGAVTALYRRCKPLLDAAYREVGKPGQSFDSVLEAALDRLLAAQPPKGPIELVHPGALYKYADPALEKLTAVEKQLMRMGPDNAALLQDKVRRLRTALRQAPPEATPPAAKPEPPKPAIEGVPLPLPPARPLPNEDVGPPPTMYQ